MKSDLIADDLQRMIKDSAAPMGNVSSLALSHFDDLDDESSMEEVEGELKG